MTVLLLLIITMLHDLLVLGTHCYVNIHLLFKMYNSRAANGTILNFAVLNFNIAKNCPYYQQ